MQLLDKHIAFVKDQAFLQDKLAARYAANEWRAARHRHSAAQFRVLLSDLEAAQKKLDAEPSIKSEKAVVSPGILMRPEDLDDLPEELLQELSLSDTDKLECEILEVIRNAGGILPLNKIIIGLYRKSGVIHKRPALNSRLHRMVDRHRLYLAQNRRGIFSISQLTGDDANLIDADQDQDQDQEEDNSGVSGDIKSDDTQPVQNEIESTRTSRRRRGLMV